MLSSIKKFCPKLFLSVSSCCFNSCRVLPGFMNRNPLPAIHLLRHGTLREKFETLHIVYKIVYHSQNRSQAASRQLSSGSKLRGGQQVPHRSYHSNQCAT